MTKEQILAALTSAFAVSPPAKIGPTGGCGRVYVSVTGDRATINGVAAAAKKLGIIFQRKAHYGMRNALYVGYDNASGRLLAKGEAVAEALTAAGIPAYMDAHGD